MPGHVFLVHGDLTKLSCDAWLVPSGNSPRPGSIWRHAVADTAPPGTPLSWAKCKGQVIPWEPLGPDEPRPWVVCTINYSYVDAAKFVEPAREFLRDAAKASLGQKARNNRSCPLLALPVIGAGKGGGAEKAGEIVQHLLPALYAFTEENPVDIALVMKDDAQYAAAQAARSRLMGELAWPELNEFTREKVDGLALRANRQELVLFLGAGVSQAAGLPAWSDLLKEMAGKNLARDPEFDRLSQFDRARVIQRRLSTNQNFREAVANLLRAERYSLAHALLAALPTREVVTTNYDTLFEAASEAIGRSVEVLPYHQVSGDKRWLLKLHGCISKPEQVVLTREDYLRYDVDRGALAGLVQGLLITRHMLFVGFSLNDDNFYRIADEVRRAVQREPFGTSLSVAGNQLPREVWVKDLDWAGGARPDRRQRQSRPGAGSAARGRHRRQSRPAAGSAAGGRRAAGTGVSGSGSDSHRRGTGGARPATAPVAAPGLGGARSASATGAVSGAASVSVTAPGRAARGRHRQRRQWQRQSPAQDWRRAAGIGGGGSDSLQRELGGDRPGSAPAAVSGAASVMGPGRRAAGLGGGPSWRSLSPALSRRR